MKKLKVIIILICISTTLLSCNVQKETSSNVEQVSVSSTTMKEILNLPSENMSFELTLKSFKNAYPNAKQIHEQKEQGLKAFEYKGESLSRDSNLYSVFMGNRLLSHSISFDVKSDIESETVKDDIINYLNKAGYKDIPADYDKYSCKFVSSENTRLIKAYCKYIAGNIVQTSSMKFEALYAELKISKDKVEILFQYSGL